MSNKNRLLPALLAVCLAFVAAPSSAQAGGESFILMARGDSLPRGIEKRVAAAGGEITRLIPEVGLAVVTGGSADFSANASRIPGIIAVIPNIRVQMTEPLEAVALDFDAEDVGNPPFSGSADFYFDLQWGHTAVGAPAAWAAGRRGDGVRVAVLDGGFDLDHPDLAPNIDFESSANFVAGEDLEYGLPGPFSHGTHVAGTVAAAQNDFGVIGVAPDAELILVKVLGDGGSGSFADVISGIVHAANVGADVINMSLGAALPRSGIYDEEGNRLAGANEVAALLNATSRATAYAYQQGVTVISSAGNDAINSDKAADLVFIPSQSSHVISISASAPIGWATDPENASFAYLASYSNYGKSHIDFAAPGGDGAYPGNELCEVAGVVVPCWVFDLVFSTGNGGWYWSAGTSMASPHAAGIAALIIGANGGSMHPAQVESVLRATAEDFGKRGKDLFFGHGQVSAD
jgi:subtilisin family serine protease